jgi:hypothetical protein
VRPNATQLGYLTPTIIELEVREFVYVSNILMSAFGGKADITEPYET